MARLLPNPCNHRRRKLFGTHLFLTDPFLKNVISVHPILNRLEPGIVHFLRNIGLTNADIEALEKPRSARAAEPLSFE